MVCTSVKEGLECSFMTKTGCGYNGGTCHIIIEACEGCQKATEYPSGKYCLYFPILPQNGVWATATWQRISKSKRKRQEKSIL